MIELLTSAFVVGLMVSIPPGAVTVAVCQRTIAFDYKKSAIFTLGSCVADVFYLLIVLWGLAPLLSENSNFKIVFGAVCTIMLVYFAIDAFQSRKRVVDAEEDMNMPAKKDFVAGIAITLLNPTTVAGWMVIAGAYFINWRSTWPNVTTHGYVAILMMMVGVATWFVFLIFVVHKMKKFMSTKILDTLIVISGIFFLLFAGLVLRATVAAL